jgi:hypothetical protein
MVKKKKQLGLIITKIIEVQRAVMTHALLQVSSFGNSQRGVSEYQQYYEHI